MLQDTLNGIAIGGVYAVFALGYTLVFSILRVINFAHGAIFTVGAYLTWALTGPTVANGVLAGYEMPLALPFWVAVVAGSLGAGLLGVVIERLAFRPLRKRGSDPLLTLVSSLGVAIALVNTIQYLVGAENYRYQDQVSGSVAIGGARVRTVLVLLFGVSLVIVVALTWLINGTRTGAALRAVSEDQITARLLGINVDRLILLSFFLSGLLGGLAGTLIGMSVGIAGPYFGIAFGLKGLAVIVLGGLGDIPGAVVAGLLIGLAEAFVPGDYIGYREAVAFVVLFVALLLRPQGLLGASTDPEGMTVLDVLRANDSLILQVLVAALLALSLYLPMMAGQLSLASPGFYAVGGYTAAIMSKGVFKPADGARSSVLALLAEMLIAGAVCAALAVVIGTLALRLSGIYFALATIAFVEILRVLSLNLDLTGKAIGIFGIPQPFDTKFGFLAIGAPLLVAAMVFTHRLERTRTGRSFLAVREDELAAASMGIDLTRTKVLAFSLGGVLAGVVGALDAHVLNTWNARQGTFDKSILLLAFVLIGGTRTYLGPVAGGIALTYLPEWLRGRADAGILPEWVSKLIGEGRFIIFGVLLTLSCVFFPRGLITPELLKRLRRPARFRRTPRGRRPEVTKVGTPS